MSKITQYKCDECGEMFPESDGGIHIKEMRQEPRGITTGILDGPFDFCKKDCLLDYFAKYQFR